jgi:hypothetical protein
MGDKNEIKRFQGETLALELSTYLVRRPCSNVAKLWDKFHSHLQWLLLLQEKKLNTSQAFKE